MAAPNIQYSIFNIQYNMSEFIIVSIVLILLFSSIRRFIFFNASNAFNKAADQFMKRQEMEERKRKEEGKVYVENIQPNKKKIKDEGEYVDYEEVEWGGGALLGGLLLPGVRLFIWWWADWLGTRY